jgi:hypothetical protein
MVANGDGAKKIWATEFGAPTNGPTGTFVSEDAQSRMVSTGLSLFRSYDWAGPLFWYSGRDVGTSTSTRENFFGLLRNDFSPKPAYLALRNLIAVVRSSPGAGRSGRLDWDLKSDQRVERVVLVRADGSRVIALWRPVSVWNRDDRRPEDPGLARAELTFRGSPARDVSVWRPSLSSKPALRRARARKLDLELGGDVVLVSLR